jgi:hypothetical protein
MSCDGNVGLMTYNAGTYLTSAISTNRISLRVSDSVNLGSYQWCATCGVCQEYVVIVDSFWMSRSTEPNSIPLCLPINALSKENLLDKLNLLAIKKGVSTFATLLDAMNWAQNQGIFVTNQNYPSIATNSNVLFLDAGLPASYPMGGTQWFNMAANNNIATINGGTTFVDTDVNDPWGHLQFNGTTGYVSFSAATNIPTGGSSYSISTWFNADTLSNMGLIGWGTYANNNESNSVKITSTGIINSWGTNQLSASTVVSTGSWHNIVATFDGTTRKLYYDGAMVASDTPTGLNVVGSSNLTIGRVDTQYFDGGVSLVQIFPNALTDTDINISYQNFSSKYDGTCLDICPQDVFCTTPTPTPTTETFFVPVIRPFTPPCENVCYDVIQQTFSGPAYTAFTYCLDLSNGYYTLTTNTGIAWEAFSRPNRFNLYVNGSLSQTSGWVGLDNTYAGPWGPAGSVNTAAASSAFTFTYNPLDSYEIIAEVGPQNPSNPSSDTFSISVACPSLPVTPTPTPTPTEGNWYCYSRLGNTGWNWYIYETEYDNFTYPKGVYDPVTKTLIDFPASWTPPYHYYPGYMRVIVWNCYSRKFFIVDQWTTRNGSPIRNWPSNQLKQLPNKTNTYVAGLFTIPPFNT